MQTFGKYTVIKSLGHGGMAEVFLARAPMLDRDVAIKVIYPHLASEPGFVERFRREAKLVASLRHAHIVQLHDFDVQDNQPFMVMEYLEGGTLKERLAALRQQNPLEPMPVEQVNAILAPIAKALDHAHKQGAVHRDIKPANILFTAQGEPVLGDFGIAKILADLAQISASGNTVGTPAYMSPEQAVSEPVDARSDLYSLGVMLYEMVAGRVPFQGDSPTAVMLQHLSTPPPKPREFNPTLLPSIQRVILKALAKKPAERFATAGDLARAFAEAMQDQTPETAPDRKSLSDIPTIPEERDTRGEKKGGVLDSTARNREAKRTRSLVSQRLGLSLSFGTLGCLLILVCLFSIGGLWFASNQGWTSWSNPTLTSTVPAKTVTPAIASSTATFFVVSKPAAIYSCPNTNGQLYDFEDFSNSTNGWTVDRTDNYESYYEGGAYHIVVTRKNYISSPTVMMWKNLGTRYVVETHVQRTSTSPDGGYGIYFAGLDSGNYYWFRVRDSGAYRISKYVDDQIQDPVGWTETRWVNRGAWNALGVKVDGTQITVCLNGHTLTSLSDSALRSGRVGLVGFSSDESSHVRFDDFILWKLE